MQPSQDSQNDMGFGQNFNANQGRLIRNNGTFNVQRIGKKGWTPYQDLIEMPWPRFFLLTLLAYYLVNIIFAFLFLLCGDHSFSGLRNDGGVLLLLELFFFSVQTFTTVGYGTISPTGLAANIIATFNAFAGLLAFALATGLLFARFSRPKAQFLFSQFALIATYRGGKSFQFRIANRRSNTIINLKAMVAMAWIETDSKGKPVRRFHTLPLERSSIAVFPLNWTIVHPIDKHSPLYGRSIQDLFDIQAEFIILIEGYDETFVQNVHTQGSYTAEEVREKVQFAPMYFPGNQTTILNLDAISSVLEEE